MRWQCIGGIFRPEYDSKCVVLFEPGPGDVVLSSSSVTTWYPRSRSDSTYTLAQSNASYKPTYSSSNSSFAGRPSITFASTQRLVSGTWTAALNHPFTVYAVAKFTSQPSSSACLLDSISASPRSVFSQSNNCPMIYSGASAVTASSASSVVPYVFCCAFNSTASKIYRNDSVTEIVSGNPGTQGLTGITVGTDYTGGSPSLCDLAHVSIFTGLHDASMRAKMFSYLGQRFNIATT